MNDKKFLWISLTVCLSGILLFYLVPFITGVVQTLSYSKTGETHVTFAKYAKLFCNEAFRLAFKNTILFSLISIVALNLLGFCTALLIHQLPRRGVSVYGLILPFVIPVITTTSFWKDVSGIVSSQFLSSGHAILLVVFIFVWKYMGFHTLIYLSGIRSVPESHLEAAAIDGASRIKSVLYIVLPEIHSFVLFNLMFSVIHSFRIFRDIYMLFGNYPPENMYLLQHFIQNNFVNLNYDEVMCAGYVFALIVMAVFVPLFRRQQKLEAYHDS